MGFDTNSKNQLGKGKPSNSIPSSNNDNSSIALQTEVSKQQHQQATNDHLLPYDKTNFAQSLMHMIKGNLGTGILAMPSTFALCTLLYGVISLPILCLISAYCVHLLVRSSQHLENKIKLDNLEYGELAKASFKAGPPWLRRQSKLMNYFVDGVLILSQMGICCVYIVFVVDNIAEILISRNVSFFVTHKSLLYLAAVFVILPVSYIRTLRSLSFVSGIANVLQTIGILFTVYLLILPESKHIASNELSPGHPSNISTAFTTAATSSHVDEESQAARLARGFGAAMFAFEGISVVIPVYNRMKRPEQMGGTFGTINVSYSILIVLYMLVGVTGFLRYGNDAKGSISQNLQRGELLPDTVRGLFVTAILFSYPLQFYVFNEIIWNWIQDKFLTDDHNKPIKNQAKRRAKYEYICRTVLVLMTFFFAITIKKLRLLMEVVGAISGTSLSIILPPIIHLATFWEDISGWSKAIIVTMDAFIITLGILASASGTFFSVREIIEKWHEP